MLFKKFHITIFSYFPGFFSSKYSAAAILSLSKFEQCCVFDTLFLVFLMKLNLVDLLFKTLFVVHVFLHIHFHFPCPLLNIQHFHRLGGFLVEAERTRKGQRNGNIQLDGITSFALSLIHLVAHL